MQNQTLINLKFICGALNQPFSKSVIGVRSIVIKYFSFLKSRIRDLCQGKLYEKYCPQSNQ